MTQSETKAAKDSLGGGVSCICRHVLAGLGEPVFDKLDGELARALMSIARYRSSNALSHQSLEREAADLAASDHSPRCGWKPHGITVGLVFGHHQ